MSDMIPQATLNVLRHAVNVSIQLYGIDCTLYVPTNLDDIDLNTIYNVNKGVEYNSFETRVFIEWSPDTKRLRKLGLYMEDSIPIICWLKNDQGQTCNNDQETPFTMPDTLIHSYIQVPIQYIPNCTWDTDEFEIVDIIIKNMHDAEILNCFKLAPRRRRDVTCS